MAEYYTSQGDNHLIVEQKYYNMLDIEGFSQMMKDPSYCYKFYWLEAIVHLISENVYQTTFDEIIDEMISNAWYSVREFHIHLSGIQSDGMVRDGLERAVNLLSEYSSLPANASKVEIKNAIKEYNNELKAVKEQLTNMVPYSSKLKKEVYFNPDWVLMIQDNTVNILGWIQYEKVKWLQNNNPEVLGLVYKLAPIDEKMRKLSHARKLWEGILDVCEVRDVFTGKPVNTKQYDIDHFIPWSFVMNDELWNLMPMDSSLNSSKNNKLPKWEPFFEIFAGNQFIMYKKIYEKPELHKLFEACYRDNLHSIWAVRELYTAGKGKPEFCHILEKNMQPVYDSARRQGYEIWNRDKVQ